MRLAEKVILITGAGAGLGRESAKLFSREGAKLVLADVNRRRVDDAVELIRSLGGECIGVQMDVRDESDISQAVDAAVDGFGRLDAMFANAGVKGRRQGMIGIEEVTEDDWHDVLDTNLTGIVFCLKHAVRVMKRQGGGTILVTSSAAGLRAYPGSFLYGATKGGVNALVRSVANDVGRFGIRVNAICPTHGMSPNFQLPQDADPVDGSYEEVWREKLPPNEMPLKLSRPPTLRDNANAALFMISDESAFMTGLSIPTVDGGTLGRVAINFSTDESGLPRHAWLQESN